MDGVQATAFYEDVAVCPKHGEPLKTEEATYGYGRRWKEGFTRKSVEYFKNRLC
jgi:hypothetical protein